VSRLDDRIGRITASLEPHTIVVGALKAGRTTELGDMGYAEPLDVLCRSLDTEARLTAAGRRTAKRQLIDLLATRARTPTSAEIGPAPIVVCGLPGTSTDALREQLGVAPGLGRPPGPLHEIDLRSMSFEVRWHVPAYAEWLTGNDPTPHLRWDRAVLAHSNPSGRSVVGSWVDVERLAAIRSTWPDCSIVIVRPDDWSLTESADIIARSCIDQRRAAGSRTEADVIERYWRWRIGVMAERLDATIDLADLVVGDLGDDGELGGLIRKLV